MRAPYSQLTVIGCVLCWSMVALHIPAIVHQVTEHGGTLPWSVLGLLSLFAVGGMVGVWLILRSRA